VVVAIVILLELGRTETRHTLEERLVGRKSTELSGQGSHSLAVVIGTFLSGISIVSLDPRTALGNKLGDMDSGEDVLETFVGIVASGDLNAVVGGNQGRTVGNKGEVLVVVLGVKDNSLGDTLGRGPEFNASRGVSVISREIVKELPHVAVEVSVEEVPGSRNARMPVGATSSLDDGRNALELGPASIHVSFLLDLPEPTIGVCNERRGLLDGVSEATSKEIPCPLDAVLDSVGEVAKGAHGDGLLRGVNGIAVALGLERDNHLRVGLGTQRAGLKKRLGVEDATVVNVGSCLEVIKSVSNDIDVALPESIVEGGKLSVLTDGGLQSSNLEITIHSLGSRCSSHALGLADVLGPEKELPVQVGGLDTVHIGNGNKAIGASADTHESVVLEELTTKSTSANNKDLLVSNLGLEGLAENGEKMVVAGVGRGELRGRQGVVTLGEGIKGIPIEPLPERGELASELYHFLRDHTAVEGIESGKLSAGQGSHKLDGGLLYGLQLESVLLRPRLLRGDPLLGQSEHLIGVGSVTDLRQEAVLLPEGLKTDEGSMELLAATPLAEVSVDHHAFTGGNGGDDPLREATIADSERDLHLLNDTTNSVLAVDCGVNLLPIKLEAASLHIGDLARLAIIQVGDASDLPEDDVVPVLQVEPLALDGVDGGVLAIGDGGDDRRLAVFAVGIAASKGIAEVKEGVASETTDVCNAKKEAERKQNE
jgi:hypothetical protein